MAVAKSVFIGLVAILGTGALALGVRAGLGLSASGPLPSVKVAEIALRPFPTPRATVAPVATPDGGTEARPVAVADAGTPAVPPPAPADAGLAKPPSPTTPAAKPDAGAPAVARPPPPPPQPVGEGLLNLRSSDTADVFVDGKKVGGSPIEGLKVRAGTHKVRFDCYDAAGNTIPGTAQSVTVAADAEATVDFTCSPE